MDAAGKPSAQGGFYQKCALGMKSLSVISQLMKNFFEGNRCVLCLSHRRCVFFFLGFWPLSFPLVRAANALRKVCFPAEKALGKALNISTRDQSFPKRFCKVAHIAHPSRCTEPIGRKHSTTFSIKRASFGHSIAVPPYFPYDVRA